MTTTTDTRKCSTCRLGHPAGTPCPEPTPGIARGDAALWPWYAPTGWETQRRAVAAYVADALLDVREIESLIHAEECGCAYEGEHTHEDISRRENLAHTIRDGLLGKVDR